MSSQYPSLNLSRKSVDDIWPVAGKRVLIRADFNVPVRGGVIENDFHIRCAIPTIRKIIEQGGICILISHRGRPEGVDMTTSTRELELLERRGRTAFFSSLLRDEKDMILEWSSHSNQLGKLAAAAAPPSYNTTSAPAGTTDGWRTSLFASLSDEEKTALLNRFLSERPQKHNCPPGYEAELSLYIVAVRLAELLDQNVFFADDCLRAREQIKKRRGGDVLLLENVRFYKEESSPNEEERLKFASVLASYGDIFINDAFGISHRDAATVTGIPQVIGHSAAGFWMQREISFFTKALRHPSSPLTAIVGGAKASDKIGLLYNLLNVIDYLCIGGGMGITFLKAKGYQVGSSPYDVESVEDAKKLLELAKVQHVQVFLPADHVCHSQFVTMGEEYGSLTSKVSKGNQPEKDSALITTTDPNVPDDYVALDIGPKTIALFTKAIHGSKMCIWNGPLGVFECPALSKGTFSIATALGENCVRRNMITIVAGGDSARAAELSGQAPRMSHVSTGGGASLLLLEGKVLPGVSILDSQE